MDIFFIIAGYLAAGSFKRYDSLYVYLKSRAIRIYPVYIAVLLFVFFIGPVSGHSWLSEVSPAGWLKGFIVNLLLLPGIFDFPIAIPIAWCLSYIGIFYVLWGLFYRAYSKRKQSWIFYIQMTLVVVIVLVVMYLLPRFIYFIVGIAVYYSPQQKVSSWAGSISLVVMLSLLSVARICYVPIVLVSSVFGYVFFLWVVNTRISNGVMTFLGNISYSFFLAHTFIMYPVKVIFVRTGITIDHPYSGLALYSIVSFFLSVFAAWVLYTFLENRSLRVRLAEQRN